MVKLTMLKVAGSTVATVGLVAGLAGAAGASSHYYGGHSHKKPAVVSSGNVVADSSVNAVVKNTANQQANTGSATVVPGAPKRHHHHGNAGATGGEAVSGDATNQATQNVTGSVKRAAEVTAPDTTGNGGNVVNSYNVVADQSVNLEIKNKANQTANSGDATVVGGGSAATGAAVNTANQSTSFSVN